MLDRGDVEVRARNGSSNGNLFSLFKKKLTNSEYLFRVQGVLDPSREHRGGIRTPEGPCIRSSPLRIGADKKTEMSLEFIKPA